VFCLWLRNKALEFWISWWDILSAEETVIPKVPHEDHIDNFFRLSRRSAQRIHTRGKNSKCRILKRCNGSPSEAHSAGSSSCVLLSRFFLLHDIAPAQKTDSLPIFDPKKCYNLLSPPRTLHFFYLRQNIFCSPSWKWS